MINVACVNVGPAYEDKYVDVLHAMVTEYLPMDFKFFCISDRERKVHHSIEMLEAEPNLPGYWNKVSLFKRGQFTGPTLYFDLDIIVKGDLSFLCKHMYTDFVSIRGFSGGPTYNSSVMLWKPKKCYDIYDWFKPRCIKKFPTDQEFITAVKGLGHFFPKEQVVSYKLNKSLVKEASVVVFHGQPKPTDLDIPMVTKWWGSK